MKNEIPAPENRSKVVSEMRPADLKNLALNAVLAYFFIELATLFPLDNTRDSLMFAADMAIGITKLNRMSTELAGVVRIGVDDKKNKAIRKYDGINALSTFTILATASRLGFSHEHLMMISVIAGLAFEILIQEELAKKYLAKQGMINS